MARRIYGYMRVYDGLPEDQVRADEQRLREWAEGEGYDLVAVYQETDEGSVTELTELVGELNRTGTRVIVVPSVEHFGRSPLLQEHLWAYVVGSAQAEVHEVSQS